MDTRPADRRIEALFLAKQCIELGARVRVASVIAGMPAKEIMHLFFAGYRHEAPRGRPPNSMEWYHTANLLNRVDASLFCSIYERMRELRVSAAPALIAAYKHYCRVCHAPPRIGFDRAYDLATHLDVAWGVHAQHLALKTCGACHSQYLVGYGIAPGHDADCPFCRLVVRYSCDPRVQSAYQVHCLPNAEEVSRALAH